MNKTELLYLVFGTVLLLALFIDLGFFSKKSKIVSYRLAGIQTIFWVLLAFSFAFFIYYEENKKIAIEFISAYLLEWSLSVDNIFVFIINFTAFNVQEKYYGRVLLIGVLMAIFFRILFITAGVVLVNQFHWVIYFFGFFLLYTGYKMFVSTEDEQFIPQESPVYKFLIKYLPITTHDGNGKFIIRQGNKPVYTSLFIVIILLAFIDIVFALDSIPAVLGISNHKLVIYTSNIFAVLGLRSLFFLLRGAVSKFDYLQQGIAIVLLFIGIKMLLENWINKWIGKDLQVIISLFFIIFCIVGSILYSIKYQKKGTPRDML